jgi:hypothetical protein
LKKIYFILCFFICACSNNSRIDLQINNKVIIPKIYNVKKTNSKIVIDGIANEKSWQDANLSDDFIDIEGYKIPSQKTNVKMLWDDKHLYVYAKLFEDHIWGDITQRDEVIFYNNDFEVFINPNDDVFNYGEIQINALGTEWDLFLNKPYRLGGKADSSWNIYGLKSAVHIDGTLNDSNDIDNFWTVEMAIPLEEIAKLSKKKMRVSVGDVWRINFSRVNWDFDLTNGKYSRKKENGKYLPEYNWVWSPQGKINMHIPENWGYLIFNENIIDNHSLKSDLELEHTLYAIFREVKFGYLKYLNNEEEGTYVEFDSEKINGKTILSNFLKTKDGFTISTSFKMGLLKYSIDQSGLIKRNDL